MFVKRLTLISFLCYFVLSGMLALIGVLLSPMALLFDIPIPEMARVFGWLTIGNFTGAVVALVIFDYVSSRRLMLGLYMTIGIAVILLSFQESPVSSRLISVLLLAATLGTAGSPWISSWVVEWQSSKGTLYFACSPWISSWVVEWQSSKGTLYFACSCLFIVLLSAISAMGLETKSGRLQGNMG